MAIQLPLKVAVPNAKYAVVNVADNTTTVFDGPCLLLGVNVLTALSAQALPIKDGATQVAAMPASAAAGAYQAFPGVRLETSLVVDPDDAGTGSVAVFYLPI